VASCPDKRGFSHLEIYKTSRKPGDFWQQAFAADRFGNRWMQIHYELNAGHQGALGIYDETENTPGIGDRLDFNVLNQGLQKAAGSGIGSCLYGMSNREYVIARTVPEDANKAATEAVRFALDRLVLCRCRPYRPQDCRRISSYT
jgi:hypothetical protein